MAITLKYPGEAPTNTGRRTVFIREFDPECINAPPTTWVIGDYTPSESPLVRQFLFLMLKQVLRDPETRGGRSLVDVDIEVIRESVQRVIGQTD